jgi:uncharacterized protein (TIGR02145 family)
MKKALLSLAGLFLTIGSLFSQVDSISNIRVAQRKDGSKIVDIYYDLAGPEYYYNIEIQVSFDDGIIYATIDSISGDKGTIVFPGLNKHIIWDAGQEFSNLYINSAFIKIVSSKDYLSCGRLSIEHDGINYGTVVFADRCWLDRNIGAGEILGNGDYYQWGRLKDGHQLFNSDTTSILSNSDIPGHNKFIIADDAEPYDWRSPQNDNLWQGVDGINNPCPEGFRVPNINEWLKVANEWSNFNNPSESPLKVPFAGFRWSDGEYVGVLEEVDIWSSTVENYYSIGLSYSYGTNYFSGNDRAFACSIRCVADISSPINPYPLNGSSNISEFPILHWNINSSGYTYDIYFGSTENPSIVSYHQDSLSFNPGILENNTTYYWRVIALKQGIALSGGEWSFTTRDFICGSSKLAHNKIVYSSVEYNDRCWLNKNLGAIQPASSYNDYSSFGDYYQWGRLLDGHEKPSSIVTSVLSNQDDPEHGMFIISNSNPYDWRVPQNESLWHSISGNNNPCPEDWHVPSISEWISASNEWSNRISAVNSPLKLPSAGYRSGTIGNFLDQGTTGNYWSSTPSSSNCSYLYFDINNKNSQATNRINGMSVRCIKNETIQIANPLPSSDSILQTKYQKLSWSAYDPDGDILSFDIYFGIDSLPTLIAQNYSDTIFDPGPFQYNKTYYWRIVARDNYGSQVFGDLWKFTVDIFKCGITSIKIDSLNYGTLDLDGQCWLDRNLGASRVALSYVDGLGSGDLYQWFRPKDGHENRYSNTTNTISNTCNPNHGEFIVNPNWGSLGYWQFPIDTQGCVDPCPTGWKTPNVDQWTQYLYSYPGIFNSPLHITFAGYRDNYNGVLGGVGYYGNYWTSDYAKAIGLFVNNWYVYNNLGTAFGMSVRCIKDDLAPNKPSDPTPLNNELNQQINDLQLKWKCSHPTSQLLLYNIYFGLNPDPPLFIQNHPDTTVTIDNLELNKIYYWKILAIDQEGNSSYSDEWHFKTSHIWPCGVTLKDSRDSNTYKTVQIGNQCWLAENLKTGTMINGGIAPTYDTIIQKFCYNNLQSNCDIYGGLYNWNEMMQYQSQPGSQGICPIGLHVPNSQDWTELITFLGGENFAGGSMKDTNQILWNPPNTGANNASGFTAIGSGKYNASGFNEIKNIAQFWSSSPGNSSSNFSIILANNTAQVIMGYNGNSNGNSVRCIRNNNLNNQPPNQPVLIFPSNGSSNQPVDLTISWACIDPNNDQLIFDIYFGSSNPPPLVKTGVSNTNYNPGLLINDTTYYFQLIIYDDHTNVTIGSLWNFKTKAWMCGDSLKDNRDGQIYKTVLIGNQCWIAKNINIGTKILTYGQTDNNIIEKYCYENDLANCDVFGGLYQWDEIMQYTTNPGTQGICMDNWHIPTDEEWKTLEGSVDSQYGVGDPIWNNIGPRGFDAGKNLKAALGWDQGLDGIDQFGFRVVPSGMLEVDFYNQINFASLGLQAYFWNSSSGLSRKFDYSSDKIDRNWLGADKSISQNSPYFALSVRCMKNCPEPPTQSNAGLDQPNLQDTLTFLEGNIPYSGEGKWKLIFGTGGEIDNENDPSTAFIGKSGHTYGLTWTISTWCQSSKDTVYISFMTNYLCGQNIIDSRNNYSYPTITMGSQCWMKKGLNIGVMLTYPGGYQTNNGIIEKNCYNNNEGNCDIFGGLYKWSEMMQYNNIPGSKGICMDNWHVPTDNEWKMLEGFADSYYEIGDPIWDLTGWRGYDVGSNLKTNDFGGTNTFNFNSIPGGYIDDYGSFNFFGEKVRYHTSSFGFPNTWYRELASTSNYIYRNSNTSGAYYVRCIRAWSLSPLFPSNPNPIDGAIDESSDVGLSWICSDPENDLITYDLYFGATNPPPPFSIGQTNNTCIVTDLNDGVTYYWKIIAHDNYLNSSEGPVWQFTTLNP